MTPFGFIEDGTEIESFVDDQGDRWYGQDKDEDTESGFW